MVVSCLATDKARKLIDAFERDHNHSWYDELFQRNSGNLDDTALFYRGNTISYEQLFERMRLLAGALQSAGVKKGMEIPVCLSNTPELVYVMGAASMLGAKINVFSASFPLDYITEIINGCDAGVGFFEDNFFDKIHLAVEASCLARYVLCSLSDSLPTACDAKTVKGNEFVCFASSVEKWTASHHKAVWFYDFIHQGEHNSLVLNEPVGLEDEFTVTYTSGSTNARRPKAIVQRVRSFCVIGRFHDPDVMYGMQFKAFRGLAVIPPHSNTNLISCISDTLMQGAVLSMEPVYNEQFFLDSLLLNQPCFVIATRSFWLTAMKRLLTEDSYRSTKLPFLLMVFAVGEELSANEEKYLNHALRKADAGKNFHHLPISPVCFCVGGGDCEHGSILYRLFRAVTNFTLNPSSERRYGMTPFDFVDIAVLDAQGNRLGVNQVGRLVANSPCTMKCYKNDLAATKAFFVTDSCGQVWGDMSVYGYIDKHGKVYMRNRILDDGQSVPPFKIADEILISRAFLSCEVVHVEDQYIAHVEFLPKYQKDQKSELQDAKQRCEIKFGKELSAHLFFRIHKGTASFKLTSSGKRDIKALMAEGTTETVPV